MKIPTEGRASHMVSLDARNAAFERQSAAVQAPVGAAPDYRVSEGFQFAAASITL